LDEPELYLNPALLRGLPDFYSRHLGQPLGNQLWLVTHSDALLRQAVGDSRFSVYHMSTPTHDSAVGENQATVVQADSELERAIIDLVGDLATYRPQGKVVLLEGGGHSEFDVTMISRLMPDAARRLNLVSGGAKRRVSDLYESLIQTAERLGVASRFYAIVDRDSDPLPENTHPEQVRRWSVYHIENFLLEPRYITAASQALSGAVVGREVVETQLLESARGVIDSLVQRSLQKKVNDALVRAINIGGDPGSGISGLVPSIQATTARLELVLPMLADEDQLKQWASEDRSSYEGSLADGTWRYEMPGRDVLQRFVGAYVKGANYEAFRNLIIDQMIDDSFVPPEISDVMEDILTGTP
jgi:hypothetical protein